MACPDLGRKGAQANPYKSGSQKTFWISVAESEQPHSARLAAYFWALLTANEHESAVPHFAELPVYLRILGDEAALQKLEDQQAKRGNKRQKRILALADIDDWDVPVPEKKKRKQPKKRAKPKELLSEPALEGATLPALTDVASQPDEQEDAPALDNISHEGDVLSQKSGSMSEAEDLVTVESWEKKPLSERQATEAQPVRQSEEQQSGGTPAKTNKSSSSSSDEDSSSSTSSSSGSSSDEQGDGPASSKALAKTKATAARAKSTASLVTRNFTNRIEYGMHHLVPRFKSKTDKTIQSYQMTCHLPEHNTGDKKCSRELTVNLAGSEENARRVLKAWVLLGHGLPTRQEHMDPSTRQDLLNALNDGTLLPEHDLDVIKTSTAEDTALAPLQPQPSGVLEGASNENLLGKRTAGVTAAVHKRMLVLAASGGIPITTPAQRKRNKLTPGTEYGVPAELREALFQGYLHPNLPPPRGFRWAYQGGKWFLRIHGG